MSIPARKPVPSRSARLKPTNQSEPSPAISYPSSTAALLQSDYLPSISASDLPAPKARQYETFDTAAFARIMTLQSDTASTAESVASSGHTAGGPSYETSSAADNNSGVESMAIERPNAASSVETSSIRERGTPSEPPPRYDEATSAYETHSRDPVLTESKRKIDTKTVPGANGHNRPEINVDTFEGELLTAQKQEARAYLSAGDYQSAENTINDVLENNALSPFEAPFWAFRRVLALQMVGRWQESLSLIRTWEDSGWTELAMMKTSGCMRQYEAEALLQIGEYGPARSTCVRALRILEKAKEDESAARYDEDLGDPLLYDLGDPTTAFNMCMELMTRITSALDKPLEVQFYKSRLVDGYVSEPALAQRNREQLVRDRQAMMWQYNILYDHDFRNPKFPTRISGVQGRDYESDLMNAFEDGMKTNNADLLEILLQDEHIGSRKGRSRNSTTKAKTTTYSPLYYAVTYGNAKCVADLIDRGADVNAPVIEYASPLGFRNDDPCEALSLAARLGQVRIVEILLENGADINGNHYWRQDRLRTAPTRRTTTPLHQALRYNTVQMAKLLLEFGASRSYWDAKTMTPLHIAAEKGFDEMVVLLLDTGADIHEQATLSGKTPLHFATAGGNPTTIRLLLSRGASPYIKNTHGHTPAMLIKEITGADKGPVKDEVKAILRKARETGGGTWLQRKFDNV